jgi:hypothetical protein
MAAPVYGSSSHASNGSTTSLVVAAPSGITNGDILILSVYYEYTGSVTVTPPTGFTEITGAAADNTGSSPNCHLREYWKRASGESGNYTIGFSVTVSTNATIARYTGAVASGNPVEAAGSTTGNGTSCTLPSITTLTNDTLVIGIAASFEWLNTWTSAELTERTETDAHVIGDVAQASAGASGTKLWTQNASNYFLGAIFNLASTTGGGGGASHTFGVSGEYPTGTSLSSTNPVSTTFTCPSGTTVLVLMLLYAGSTDRTGGAPTYNGVAMTLADGPRRAVTSPEETAEVWYMLAPPTGVASTLSVPNSGALSCKLWMATFNSSTGASALDVTNWGQNTSTNPSISITTTKNGDAIAAVVGNGATTWSPTARSGTQLFDRDLGSWGGGSQYFLQSSQGAQTVSWTFGTSEDWVIIAAAFYPYISGAVALSSTATLTVSGDVTTGVVTGSVSIAASSSLAVSGSLILSAGGAISSSATLQVAAQIIRYAALNLQATGAVTFSGLVLRSGTCSIQAAAALSTSGQVIRGGSAAITAQAVFQAGAAVTHNAGVQVSATSSVSIAPAVTRNAGAQIASTTTLAVSGSRITRGAIAISVASSLTVTGETSSAGYKDGALAVQASVVLSVQAARTASASLAIASASTLSIAGGRIANGLVSFPAQSALAITASMIRGSSVVVGIQVSVIITAMIISAMGITGRMGIATTFPGLAISVGYASAPCTVSSPTIAMTVEDRS